MSVRSLFSGVPSALAGRSARATASSVWASSIVNSATAVRRRDSRCAPQPSSLSHFVRHRAHVGSGGDAGAKADAIDVDAENFEFFDLDLDGLSTTSLLLARQFVGRNSFNFLGGEGRRDLLDHASETGGDCFHLSSARKLTV